MNTSSRDQSWQLAGLFTLSLRLVVGWTYFSAFWRRVVLENKLNPDEAGYIGEKFNHFLPNALGIKPMIEYLVTNPDSLHSAMVTFTIIEGIVGALLIFGFFTRLMSIGVISLAIGILLGSGWLGTTCLDEWQIGVLGIAGGFTLFLTGSGYFSVDNYLLMFKRYSDAKLFSWFGSGQNPFLQLKSVILVVSIAIFGLTLYTNQYFHGGVFGTLHNLSVKPKIEISNASINQDVLKFQIYRTEGADVYGSFMIGIEFLDVSNNVVRSISAQDLAKIASEDISNHYIAKVKPGKYSLIVPLGAKADLSFKFSEDETIRIKAIKIIDISGIEWRHEF